MPARIPVRIPITVKSLIDEFYLHIFIKYLSVGSIYPIRDKDLVFLHTMEQMT